MSDSIPMTKAEAKAAEERQKQADRDEAERVRQVEAARQQALADGAAAAAERAAELVKIPPKVLTGIVGDTALPLDLRGMAGRQYVVVLLARDGEPDLGTIDHAVSVLTDYAMDERR